MGCRVEEEKGGARLRREYGQARVRKGAGRGRWLGQNPKGGCKPLSFSFQNFNRNFQMDFEFSFVFKSNHSIQKSNVAA
jgi:hypothetical protein